MKRGDRILMSLSILIFCILLSVPASAASYTVVKGDCLWRIAQRHFGTGMRWVEIYQANRGDIRDPNLIYPGQVFVIPGIEDAAPAETAAEPETSDETPAETPAEAPAETPAEAPAEAPTETPVEAPEETPAEAPAEAPKPVVAAGKLLAPLVGTPSDYSDPQNWACLPNADKAADTLYIYNTMYVGEPSIVPITDETMRAAAQENIELNCGVFSETTNVFVPYYRQSSLNAIAELTGDRLVEFQMQEQRTDLYAALDYYFENLNGGRPFILAGHSQGALMCKLILREYMQLHPEYYERMIASYVLGCSITDEDMQINPALRFAEGANDVGVIVSWNTEGRNNTDNLYVMPNAYVINPLNWSRTSMFSASGANHGSRVVNSTTGKVDESVPGLADARIDLGRGVVICSNVNLPYTKVEGLSGANPFGEKSFNDSEYLNYYRNIEENVKARTEAWFAANKG